MKRDLAQGGELKYKILSQNGKLSQEKKPFKQVENQWRMGL